VVLVRLVPLSPRNVLPFPDLSNLRPPDSCVRKEISTRVKVWISQAYGPHSAHPLPYLEEPCLGLVSDISQFLLKFAPYQYFFFFVRIVDGVPFALSSSEAHSKSAAYYPLVEAGYFLKAQSFPVCPAAGSFGSAHPPRPCATDWKWAPGSSMVVSSEGVMLFFSLTSCLPGFYRHVTCPACASTGPETNPSMCSLLSRNPFSSSLLLCLLYKCL